MIVWVLLEACRLCDCNARSELNLGVQPAGFTVVKSYRPTDDHKDYLRVLLTYIFIMAARQLAGRRPLYFTEVCFYILLLTFFAALSRRPLGRSSPHFATCSLVTVVYKIESEIWGPFHKKIGGPKTSKFWRDLGLRDILRWRQCRLQLAVVHCTLVQNWR